MTSIGPAWWFRETAGDRPEARWTPTGDEATWFRRVLPRLPRSAYQGKASARLARDLVPGRVAWRPPAGRPGSRTPAPPTGDIVRTIELRQGASGLAARAVSGNHPVPEPSSAGAPPGSSVGLIRTRNPRIKVDSFTDRPAWASEWGKDRFGFWCAFRVKGVRQRLRWIPAGEFLMGSPEEEAGRYDDEGPQHRVRITRGFWLFDTPCTQALWEAVMGKNPSRFRSPTRPVEQVSWDDCQTFIERLNGLLEGIKLSLPSEAQWEYACRAGRTTRYPFGDDETQLGDNAWFSGNSKGKTHVVGKKRPNRMGPLRHAGERVGVVSGRVGSRSSTRNRRAMIPWRRRRRLPAGSSGAVRGTATRGTCAPRPGSRYDPGFRDDYLGFRCAEFQSSGPVGAGSRVERGDRRSERRAEHVAEQSSDRESPSETRWLTPGRPGRRSL